MKKQWRGIVAILIIVASMFCIVINSYAHSGRTDSSGGHKDNRNRSGLGYYHYHCGGYPAHLHKNGICPYSSNKSKTKATSTTKKKNSTTSKKTVAVTGIKIKNTSSQMEEGTNKYLVAEILPSNAMNKKITWKSSNKEIVSVDGNGYITAKKVGTANITASTSNGKTSSIQIKVKEKEYTPKSTHSNNLITKITSSSNNINGTTNNNGDSEAGGVLTGLALLGGGSYLIYKKQKKSK